MLQTIPERPEQKVVVRYAVVMVSENGIRWKQFEEVCSQSVPAYQNRRDPSQDKLHRDEVFARYDDSATCP